MLVGRGKHQSTDRILSTLETTLAFKSERIQSNPVPIQSDLHLSRILVHGKKVLVRVGSPTADLLFTLQYRWKDGKDFFDTCTAHLRHLQEPACNLPHKRLRQWQSSCTMARGLATLPEQLRELFSMADNLPCPCLPTLAFSSSTTNGQSDLVFYVHA